MDNNTWTFEIKLQVILLTSLMINTVFRCFRMDLEKERDQHFEHAIKEGDLDLVKKLLEEGKSLNTWNEKNWTPLYSAVATENGDLIRLFLEKGAEVNFTNRYNFGAPLHCASDKGRCDFVKLLLENGAEVNKKSGPIRNTALFLASAKGHFDIVEVLLANKADVHLVNNQNETPLDVACQNGHLKVVKALLDNGADLNWSGRWEGTPLIYACQEHHYDIVKILLDRGANMNPVGCNRPLHTPLYHAALYGNTNVVKLLLQRGADINWPKTDGDTPLHGVCYRGHSDLAEILLDMGAELNRPSIDGKSPLYIACATGHSRIVKMLLARGADISQDIESAWDLSWHTPVYMALREGNREMITMLLNREIDMFHPYDEHHPMAKTISEVRTSLFYGVIMNSNPNPIDAMGKFCCKLFLKEYLTKLKVAGLDNTLVFDEEILGKCIAELKRINSYKIFQNVTLGIVFQRAKEPLYQRNQKLLKKVEEYLNSPLPQDEFPIYAQILRNTLQKSKRKLSLLTIASKVLEKQECQPKLPILALECILKYLDEKDLENVSSLE